MFSEWKMALIALIGGLLGWALGKILDKYITGHVLYAIIAVLAILVIVLAK